MPRGFIPISRVNSDEVETQREVSPWLHNISNQLAAKENTAVEAARVRANMINQVNNIIKNPPRYATVDDAVQDMRERTGLNKYLNKITASKRDSDGLLTRDAAKKMVQGISDKKKLLSTAEEEIPKVLQKYDTADILVDFIKNNIENSRGLAASVPQIQHDILHVFGRKYQNEDIMNDEVAKFISKLILEARAKNGPVNIDRNIGLGVGQDKVDDQDYWAGMMPQKM